MGRDEEERERRNKGDRGIDRGEREEDKGGEEIGEREKEREKVETGTRERRHRKRRETREMSEYDDDDFDSFSYGGDSWDGGGGGGGGGEIPQYDPRFPLMTEELLIPVAAMATGALTGALAGGTARKCKLLSPITTVIIGFPLIQFSLYVVAIPVHVDNTSVSVCVLPPPLLL